MRRISLTLLTTLMFYFPFAHAGYLEQVDRLYSNLSLRELGLNLDIFEYALKGFDKIASSNSLKEDIISIADYSQSSANKRFYILDLKNEKVLFQTWVAHGKNTGDEFATEFSNIDGSKKSSLGFYLTAETYTGSNGYSLRLDGLDVGYNENARRRYIVMHGAWYVSQDQIDKFGRIGRSWGCPAIEQSVHERLINIVKNRTVLFHYADDVQYLESSIWLQ